MVMRFDEPYDDDDESHNVDACGDDDNVVKNDNYDKNDNVDENAMLAVDQLKIKVNRVITFPLPAFCQNK